MFVVVVVDDDDDDDDDVDCQLLHSAHKFNILHKPYARRRNPLNGWATENKVTWQMDSHSLGQKR